MPRIKLNPDISNGDDDGPLFADNPFDDEGGYQEENDTASPHQPVEAITLDFQPAFQSFQVTQEDQLAYLLLKAVTASQSHESSRVPLNVCLVIDQSSSMRGEKLMAVKAAARYVVDQLTVADFFSLISFNDRATVVVNCQKVSSRESIKSQIDSIEGRGGTELATGLFAGIQEMRPATAMTPLNYLLLLTDGQTYGDADRCVQLGEEAARYRIVVHPMGVGLDWNEDLLETVAAKCGGSSEFIESADQIVRIFMQKINQLRSTLAHTSTLSFSPVQGVRLKQLHRVSPNLSELPLFDTEDNYTHANLGALGKGSEYSFLLEVVIPACPAGTYKIADIVLSYLEPGDGNDKQHVSLPIGLSFADGPKMPINTEVKQIIERVTAFKLQARAWQDIANGDVVSGTKRLAAVSTRLLSMGQVDLANAVQTEVENLEQRGVASNQGKKRIKYGTRGLVE